MAQHGAPAPAHVGQLVPDPVQVLIRHPEAVGEPQPAQRPRVAGHSGHLRARAEAGYTSSVCQPADRGARGHGLADLHGQAGHRPVFVRGQRLFHLHRFEDHHRVARRHPLALAGHDLHDRSLHGAGQGVAPRTAPARTGAAGPGRPGAGAARWPGAPVPAAPPAPAIRPAGSTTSSRLPPTSTVIRSRALVASAACVLPVPDSATSSAGGVYAGIWPLNSVSIHRVCTENGSAVNASSRTTARWKGSTVGMPPTSNSASARRDRSSAWARVAPVTMSFASSESNACGTVMPAVYPASTRTPGPAGSRHRVIVPGAGRNPRPGSSALTRNSIE